MSPLDIAIDQSEHLLQLLHEYDVVGGVERSIKYSPQGLFDNRFLIGIEKNVLSLEKWHALFKQMEMPVEYIETFDRSIDAANVVLIGFDQESTSCRYKVYLEYWDQLIARLKSAPSNKARHLLHLGFKWNIEDSTKKRITNYHCYPLLSASRILSRIRALYLSNQNLPSFTVIEALFEKIKTHPQRNQLIYMEVEEPGNNRKSFDLNLYKLNLSVSVLKPMLNTMKTEYGIIDVESNLSDSYRLGHIAAGLQTTKSDSKSSERDFFTLYYET